MQRKERKKASNNVLTLAQNYANNVKAFDQYLSC